MADSASTQAEVEEENTQVFPQEPVQQQHLDSENNSETNVVKTATQIPTQKECADKETKKKVDVLLKAAGDAPIMKKKKWAVDSSKTVAYLMLFIKKYIKCESSESLFIYVNQAFAPAPDQVINNLYECFGADGKLVLYYCKSQAWG